MTNPFAILSRENAFHRQVKVAVPLLNHSPSRADAGALLAPNPCDTSQGAPGAAMP